MLATARVSLFQLDLGHYKVSRLHDNLRIFRESNCYVDVWIELLHASGIDPASIMAFTCAIDFEGDQWTFFKPPSEDLIMLHGIDVHEMQFYRPAPSHIVEQLRYGRTVILEVDSFYLPDTGTTAYRRSHVKSSIAVEAIDIEGESLRYFHGVGYYDLADEDYRGIFRLGKTFSGDVLPPYVELVRFDAGPSLKGESLREAARETLRKHLRRRPRCNPWLTFGERLITDLPNLRAGDEAAFHVYAFATVRQSGSAFELASDFLKWLANYDIPAVQAACQAFDRQAEGAKALLFQLARRRSFDPWPQISRLAQDWDIAQNELEQLCYLAPTVRV